MNAQQIANVLKSKGFDTNISSGLVTVSLNRPINTMEVWTALDFKIEQEHIFRSGKEVVIIGLING